MNLFNTDEFQCTNLVLQAHLSFPNFLYSAILTGQWEIHIWTYLSPFQSSSPGGLCQDSVGLQSTRAVGDAAHRSCCGDAQ